MVVLAKFYNEKYHIKIFPCLTKIEIEQTIRNFLRLEDKQIGIFFPSNENPIARDGHRLPLIINKNENGKPCIYIGDSIGVLNADIYAFIYELSEKIEAEIFLDPIVRLDGDEGCASETLYWLISGLRLGDKFKQNIRSLDSSHFPSVMEKYDNANKIKLFLSIPDQLVTSQQRFFSMKMNKLMQLNIKEMKLINSKKNLSLAAHREKYKKTSQFYVLGGDQKELFNFVYNNFLYHLSKKFNRLAKKLSQNMNSD